MVLRLLGPCGICHFRNAPPGHSFFGFYLFPSFYSLFSSSLGVTLVSVSSFSLLFLFLIHKLNTTSVSGSKITLVIISVVPMSQDGSARTNLPPDGKEELGGVSPSESMMALGRPEGRIRHHHGLWPRTGVRRIV